MSIAEKRFIPVVVETPYAGSIAKNVRYLRACMYDCLCRSEAPYASHALYTQPGILRDDVSEEREWGIQAGFAIRTIFPKTVFYTNLGMSKGMEYGLKAAQQLSDHDIEIRQLPDDWEARARARELLCVQANEGWIAR